MDVSEKKLRLIGIGYAVAAFSAWGILPLYWKFIKRVPADQILAHRIVWSLVFCAVLTLIYGQRSEIIGAWKQKNARWSAVLGAFLIGANWFIYIWAVNADHIIECSMGYYINPLFVVFLGMVFLKERIDVWQKLSLVFAGAGLLLVAINYQGIPWIALSLTLTFGLYGLVKKLGRMNSLTSLTLETAVLAPAALGYLIFREVTGTGVFGHVPLYISLMLAGAGIVTATPLLWFAKAANRVPLTTLGFTQYLSPTFSLILGVAVFHEKFDWVHFVSFGLIWCALILLTLSGAGLLRDRRQINDNELTQRGWRSFRN